MRFVYDAVVLAGGQARRLGGADKPALTVGGRSLLGRVLDALAGAERRIVVGPPRSGLPLDVVQVREQPPGGGPLAALAAALPQVRADHLALVAADLPFLRSPHVDALLAAVQQRAGAVLVDDGGQAQWLIGVWRSAALRGALSGVAEPAGLPLRRALAPLEPALVSLPSGAGLPPWWDCDAPADLARAQQEVDTPRSGEWSST